MDGELAAGWWTCLRLIKLQVMNTTKTSGSRVALRRPQRCGACVNDSLIQKEDNLRSIKLFYTDIRKLNRWDYYWLLCKIYYYILDQPCVKNSSEYSNANSIVLPDSG